MAAAYHLKLSRFEGPLDLLIHLIRVNEIDIFNIDIFLLTTQYLEYLRLIKFDDLADAGEFIEMAATLIEIKARMLLPNFDSEAEEEGKIEEDPRKSLQERLILHEQFKLVAEHLASNSLLDLPVYSNHEYERLEPLYSHIEAPLVGDPASLVVMYEQLMKAMTEKKPPLKVEAKTHLVTIDETIQQIENLIKTVKFLLFQGFYTNFKSRYELVVNILAVLELTRWGKLKVYQRELNGPFWIYDAVLKEDVLPIGTEPAGSSQNPQELEGSLG
jgi:segregation and condensation protein A